MDVPLLHIRAHCVNPVVEVERGDGVSDTFWLLVRAEWGSEGKIPARAISVPFERFLAELAWLAPACQRYAVGIDWDDRSLELIRSINQEREHLADILQNPPAPNTAELSARLRGGRFKRELRLFQERDLAHLLGLPHGANFSVPGAGKTSVAYAIYEAERLAKRVSQLLVIAPLSAFPAWTDEAKLCFEEVPLIARFGGGPIAPRAEILLVNYHRLAASYEDVAKWAARAPTHLVLDEAHRMKRGWEGQWGSACLNLAFLAQRRDILTGTPAPQSPGDLQALLNFLWPNQARRILPDDVLSPHSRPDLVHRVAEVIRPLFVRTTKHELGLRPPEYSVLKIPLTGLHANIYQALLDEYTGQFALGTHDRVTLAQMGEVVMYLLEAATNPCLLVAGSSPYDPIVFRHPPLEIPPDSPLRELLIHYPRYETPAKFVHLARIIEANASQNRKTLVWTNFVRNLQTLERMFARYRPAMIHGGIPSEVSQPNAPRTREQELTRFRRDPDCMVLLANPAATAEGVNLHDVCHDAIYLDRTFNAGQYLQSVDRIHRLGLPPDEETRITFLLTERTIDEHVDGRVREKAERLGNMLEDPDIVTMTLPDDEDYGPAVDEEADLTAVFTHLRGEDVH